MKTSARWLGILRVAMCVLPAVAAFSPVVAAGSGVAQAGGQTSRGTATKIPNDEIMATIRNMGSRPVGEEQLRVVDINGAYNVGIGIVHHVKPQSGGTKFAVEHSEITEIQYFISGNGALLTGGTIENAKDVPADSAMVTVLDGPSSSGSQITGGRRLLVGPGDVVIIPPNTPHGWAAIFSDEIVYLIVKVDPHKVLPAGLGEKGDGDTVPR